MRLIRWGLLVVLFIILGAATYQTFLWLGVGGTLAESQVRPLGDEDQELALIELATNTDDWGRMVTALKLLELDWPRINPALPALQVGLEQAFPRLTADVPEITLTSSDRPQQKLRLRWYKISGEHDAASWVKKLHDRPRSPLAIIGGGNSDRALRLALALSRTYPDPAQPSPLLVITTATSEKTARGNLLIDFYKARTFRFSFTNQKMVEALLQFAQHRQYAPEHKKWAQSLWVHPAVDPQVLASAVASMAGSGTFWHTWGVMRGLPQLQPYTMHAVSWQDERYSQDMPDLFEQEFKKRYPLGEFFHESSIQYGVGGFYHPAPQEQDAVGTFLARPSPVTPHSFLVLPTQTVRMRRFLINLRQRSPRDARNLVILNGDAIAFHAVYRDREVVWNILDLPYSLVFFSHRNPIDQAAGFRWSKEESENGAEKFPQRTTTGTQVILLYRDIFEALLYAVHDRGKLLGDPLHVRQRLRATTWYVPPDTISGDAPRVCNREVHGDLAGAWTFFDLLGNRQSHTGEHIIWVKPNFSEDRVDLTSKISVWTILPAMTETDPAQPARPHWQLVDAIDATYNQSRQEEPTP